MIIKNIGKFAFEIIHEGEKIENYQLHENTKKLYPNGEELLKNISKDVILEFLELEDTKLKIIVDDEGYSTIYAHNSTANELIKINGLGDHFLALVKMIEHTQNKIREFETNPNAKILNHAFIKELNRQLLSYRDTEVAIGSYRYLDFAGRPMEVHHTKIGDDGRSCPCYSANIVPSAEVQKKMDELVEWTNNVAFKDSRDFMKDIAEFHTRFVQIQPFRDGNKRTARMLTNYLLLLHNQNMVDINEKNHEEYMNSMYYATAESELLFRNETTKFRELDDKILAKQGPRTEENKYIPLKEFFERNRIMGTRNKIIADVLYYDNKPRLHANQITSIFGA